jgi:hypothetical protein
LTAASRPAAQPARFAAVAAASGTPSTPFNECPAVGYDSSCGLLIVIAVTATNMLFGAQAVASGGSRQGIPAFPFFLFSTVGVLASIGDFRVLRSGPLRGARRIVRHLWRMSFGLYIAAMSFFIGQAKVIPKPIRIYPLLAVPPFVVLIVMFYWMWRLRSKRPDKGTTGLVLSKAA